jgi:hypothetical protein
MKGRLLTVLSITAVLVAVAGFTPLGQAARNIVPRARFAVNAGKVDGLNASRAPKAGYLLALDKNKKFPASVLAGSGLTGLETVTAASAQDSSSPKVVVVNCSAGKRVVGGGAGATGTGAAKVAVTEFFPSSPTQWTVRALENDATGNSWKLTAYAFCAAGS